MTNGKDRVADIKPDEAFYEQFLVISGAERDLKAVIDQYSMVTRSRPRAGTFDDGSDSEDDEENFSGVISLHRRNSSIKTQLPALIDDSNEEVTLICADA